MCTRFESYYKTTTVSLITDIERDASLFLLKDAALNRQLSDLVQDKLFRPYLEHPLRDLQKKTELEKAGWQPLCPSVFDHRDLAGWLLKTNYAEGENQKSVGEATCGKYDNLQRPLMGQLLRKGAQAAGLDLTVPDEYLVPIPDTQGNDLNQRYFVLSRKLDLEEDRLAGWFRLYEQGDLTETLRKVFAYITLTGKADASLGNLRFTAEGRLADIDTEGIGFLKDRQEGPDNFDTPLLRAMHINTYAKAGLDQFLSSFKEALFHAAAVKSPDGQAYGPEFEAERIRTRPLLHLIEQEVAAAKVNLLQRIIQDTRYENILPVNVEYNWVLIVLSIICPLIPVVLLIESFIHYFFCSAESTVNASLQRA